LAPGFALAYENKVQMMIDFKNIRYLKYGNSRQQNAYKTLSELKVFEKLKRFNPILTGTIPIEIDLPESDLDVICACSDHREFSDLNIKLFGQKKDFNISTCDYNGIITTLCQFKSNGFKIEIFGQNITTEKQNAYLHMMIEYKIMQEKGLEFKSKIKALKAKGVKTEPAFAELLKLKEKPYEELLKM
jgi:hypothetical protein